MDRRRRPNFLFVDHKAITVASATPTAEMHVTTTAGTDHPDQMRKRSTPTPANALEPITSKVHPRCSEGVGPLPRKYFPAAAKAP